MELSILLFKKIQSMLIMIAVGFIIKKKNLVRTDQISVLSTILLYAVVPCVLFKSFIIPFNAETLKAFLIAVSCGIITQLLMIAMASCMKYPPLQLDGVEQACLGYSNCGNLLVPLISGLLGETYLFYLVPFLATNTVASWIHLPRLLNKNASVNIRKIMLNPNIIAIALGVIVYLTNMQLPELVLDTVNAMSTPVASVAMLLTGMSMADLDLKQIFLNIRYLLISVIRLCVMPIIIILLYKLSGLTFRDDVYRSVILIVVMGAAAPTATVAVMMSTLFSDDPTAAGRASAVSTMTTLLCVITMPIVVYIYQIIC